MTSLRIQVLEKGTEGFRVCLTLTEGDQRRVYGPLDMAFTFSERDREDLRWYLEDFLSFAEDPAPRIAARVEERLRVLGVELFRGLFEPRETQGLWPQLAPRLGELRIEVENIAQPSVNVPWELLRAPDSGVVLACAGRAFVRHEKTLASPLADADTDHVLRILLVISRPGGADDVPYRSVATHLLKALKTRLADRAELQVLRPPTFGALRDVLETAYTAGCSFDVVHFDGHGVYGDLKAEMRGTGPKAAEMRGYLAFESDSGNDSAFVHGEFLGKLLARTGVRLLVLNACQSAHAEPIAKPADHDELQRERTFGSFAQEVVRRCSCAVVAMQYNLYVTTAAQFISDLYGAFQAGVSLGEAVTAGRRGLADRPEREIGLVRRPLQDWIVPVVYENVPTRASIAPSSRSAEQPAVANELPEGVTSEMFPPRAGFVGGDATLLDLDRKFRTPAVVQLVGYAGIGKTAMAIEFTSWLRDTGGLSGPAVFTAFTSDRPFECVLASLKETRLTTPAFWIWDGMDALQPDAATHAALIEFLREARSDGTRFLLTSRKVEEWPPSDTVVVMDALGFDDRVRFARATCEAYGQTLTDPNRWTPLLRFSQGNPLVLEACIRQALGARSAEEFANFLESLRAGTVELAGADGTHRLSALREVFKQGLHAQFSTQERVWLSFLFLFRGYVNVTTFQVAGLEFPWSLVEWRGVKWQQIHPLLERLADLGALSRVHPGTYRIHPVLTPLLRAEAGVDDTEQGRAQFLRMLQAFCELYNFSGALFHKAYNEGHTHLAKLVAHDEENYLYVRRVALEHKWYLAVLGAMQALQAIYYQSGRLQDWAREVELITPYFIQQDETPFPGRVSDWKLIMHYRAQLAEIAGNKAEVQRLQERVIQYHEENVDDPGDATGFHPWGPVDGDARERAAATSNALSHSAALNERGAVLLQRRDPECIKDFERALEICRQHSYAQGAAMALLNLGNAYSVIEACRDLPRAERYFEEALMHISPQDRASRGQIVAQMGLARYFEQLQLKGKRKRDAAQKAFEFFTRARALLSDSPALLGNVMLNLGVILTELGDTKAAMARYLEAVRIGEENTQPEIAASARNNLAHLYLEMDDLPKAYTYARQLQDESLRTQIERLAKKRGVTLYDN